MEIAERDDRTQKPSPRQALFDEIAGIVGELHPRAARLPPVHPDSRLDRDLGLDSLTRIELLARLERRFQIVLPEAEGLAAATPADLLRALENAAPRESILAAPAPAAAGQVASADRLELPESARTLTEVLDWHCARHGDREYARFDSGPAHGTVLSYATLRESALRAASGLQALGLRPAEPVALMLPTHPDFLVAFFAALYAGGVPVPLYPPMRPGELADYWQRQAGILRNCEARILIVDATMQRHGRLIRSMTGPVERVVTVAEISAASAPLQAITTGPDELAMLQYTSGSTADPKGVMLAHRNILANLRVMGSAVDLVPGDVFVSWLPLYHDMGLIGACLGTLYYGIPLVLMPPQSFLLRPERWLWAVHRYRATLSAAPNFALELCVHRIPDDAIRGLDLRRWRLAFCGAEPVFPESLERFSERFAAFGFRREALFPVYGLAENALALAFPPPGRVAKVLRVAREPFLRRDQVVPADANALAFVSCGSPLSGHEIRIVDDSERELPDGTQGRVEFRGPSATSGYYRAPEITQRLLHDSWLDSGDLGFVFEGELYLTGRVKDLIIRAGRHVHPQAIEQAVGAIPGIRRGRVAVFGSVAGEEGTERLVVVAETRVAQEQDEQLVTLRTQVNTVVEALSGGPPDDVVLAAPGSVLKTSSGKLRRSACRSAYEAGTLGKARTRALASVLLRGLLGNIRRRLKRLGDAAFAAYAWTVFVLLAIPAALAVAVLPTLAMRWRAVRACAKALRAAAGVRATMRLEQPWPDQPCIFVANHASYLDVFVLVWALPRPVAFAAKSELAAQPLLRWLLPRFGAVFVERFDPQRCTEIVGEAQEGRRDFLFFPEGTFYRNSGLQRFHLGAFVAAANARMPVVPIALRGTRAMLRNVEWFPRRGAVEISVGTALAPQAQADTWHEALRLSQSARRFVLDHCGETDAEIHP